MPRTPLFPPNGVRAEIIQGEVGSCYLLTSLDLALNVVEGGRDLARQRFIEYPDGSIGIKIPRNRHSSHLDPAVIGSRYILDKRDPNFDEWIIPKAEVDRIDSDSRVPKRGVSSSNCLAVKLLERLSTYYYVKPPRVAGIGESILAHNHMGRGERYLDTAPGFVATLMGMHTDKLFGDHDMVSRSNNFNSNIQKLIHLKQINPNSPVYIEMNYGQPDAFGRIHSAHALRVDKITPHPSIPGEYEFHLVNPWDNSPTKIEKFTIAELKRRSAWFSHFSMTPTHALVTNLLCQCDVELGKRAHTNRHLMNALLMVSYYNHPIDHWM
ncbi:hypothetical protein [Legionella sp. km772]|uniref:hypothetical protein n=1 Tax=Legionella sp. km772 TaxID=2498111 RepID=UPI000F8E615E|nr:hypothetical protein [Legionella sp. km772]RUR13340.1 hypothetical protein ELY15_02495 [Legionella sp. km772]